MIKPNRVWLKTGAFFGLAVVISVLIFLGVEKLASQIEEWEEYGYTGVFIASFLTNSTVIIPVLGFPSIALSGAVASYTDPFSVAVVSAVGSALGEGVGYGFGRAGRKVIELDQSYSWFFKVYQKVESWFQRHRLLGWPYRKLKNLMQRHFWLTIFLFAFPYFPFDVVGVAAGTMRYPILKFLFFCSLGKFPGALLFVFFGTAIYNHFIY